MRLRPVFALAALLTLGTSACSSPGDESGATNLDATTSLQTTETSISVIAPSIQTPVTTVTPITDVEPPSTSFGRLAERLIEGPVVLQVSSDEPTPAGSSPVEVVVFQAEGVVVMYADDIYLWPADGRLQSALSVSALGRLAEDVGLDRSRYGLPPDGKSPQTASPEFVRDDVELVASVGELQQEYLSTVAPFLIGINPTTIISTDEEPENSNSHTVMVELDVDRITTTAGLSVGNRAGSEVQGDVDWENNTGWDSATVVMRVMLNGGEVTGFFDIGWVLSVAPTTDEHRSVASRFRQAAQSRPVSVTHPELSNDVKAALSASELGFLIEMLASTANAAASGEVDVEVLAEVWARWPAEPATFEMFDSGVALTLGEQRRCVLVTEGVASPQACPTP